MKEAAADVERKRQKELEKQRSKYAIEQYQYLFNGIETKKI